MYEYYVLVSIINFYQLRIKYRYYSNSINVLPKNFKNINNKSYAIFNDDTTLNVFPLLVSEVGNFVTPFICY